MAEGAIERGIAPGFPRSTWLYMVSEPRPGVPTAYHFKNLLQTQSVSTRQPTSDPLGRFSLWSQAALPIRSAVLLRACEPSEARGRWIPNIQLHASHPSMLRHSFSILRFPALREPKGSSRQILYFIGRFPILQAPKLLALHVMGWESTTDPNLVSPKGNICEGDGLFSVDSASVTWIPS